MAYASLSACARELEATGRLRRIDVELDPRLEVAAVQRRAYAKGGPALLFTKPKGSALPMLGNLYGTLDRARYILRHGLKAVEALVKLKADPADVLRKPAKILKAIGATPHLMPLPSFSPPVLARSCRVSDLPGLVSWPLDGGPYVTLPLVYTEDPGQPGWSRSNLGMYRVQMGGPFHEQDREVGLHYQIHRGIGVHHQRALSMGRPLKVAIHVGGPPALTLASVMPLPEGLPEILFAGALGARAVRLAKAPSGHTVLADSDVVITGSLDPAALKPEGPFGDHLGYYSLAHDFPVLRVEGVWRRDDAIWPFTTVGRPPQEDTIFGELIHEITGPVIPSLIPGIKSLHAVDAAGVHPLLLAVGSERYTPYAPSDRPAELLTQASALLGQGQISLAKVLMIADAADQPPPPSRIGDFLTHVLERFEPLRDLHFHTCTTVDTLDYSGSALNEGSKLVIAARGPKRRTLGTGFQGELPPDLTVMVARPGILALGAPAHVASRGQADPLPRHIASWFEHRPHALASLEGFPLLVICDDPSFVARSLENLLWTVFTRTDPATDSDGIEVFTQSKHWGCRHLILDARAKRHHAPLLEEDPVVTKKIESLGAKGGPLEGII
ncbi:MAG: UbiD family decarboxylase [Planctomycetota bacterium]